MHDIWLGNVPDAVGYTIVGDYYSTPAQFVNDTDTPIASFPDRYWMMIVYRAKMYYATFEENGALYASAAMDFNKMLSKLEFDQLPPIGYGESFA